MILDENKIEELFQKEIKLQVEKKLKTFGRDSIERVYKEVIREASMDYLKSKEEELQKEIELTVKFNADDWRDDISKRVADRLSENISNALEHYNNGY